MFHIDVHQEKGERFRVLQTTERTQIATMTLPPGGTAVEEEGHASSDQVIYVVEGRIELEVHGEKREMRAGEVALIPAASSYRMRVVGRRPCTLFNVYGPPAYPAEQRESAHSERFHHYGSEPSSYE